MPRNEKKNEKVAGGTMSRKVKAILELLDRHYPGAGCSLEFQSPLQLLIATILSAQCTDERVNMVVPALFRKYPSAKAYAGASQEELETDIHSTGFFRNKAKNIIACCSILDRDYGGEVPADLDALVKLPGIGRKTANVVLGNAFGIPGIVVDTHVARLSKRLGLSSNTDPEKIERDLMEIIPRERWILFCHQLIQHGRAICQARKPKISVCPMREYCDYAAEHGE